MSPTRTEIQVAIEREIEGSLRQQVHERSAVRLNWHVHRISGVVTATRHVTISHARIEVKSSSVAGLAHVILAYELGAAQSPAPALEMVA